MPETKLKVKCVDVTSKAVDLIYSACRQCYSAKFAGDIMEDPDASPAKREEFIKKVVESGHESPIEHVKFSFAIEGVSRALTHQLVRHRLASYSQQSQRYVKANAFNYIVPPMIAKNPEWKRKFVKVMDDIQASYNELLEELKKEGKVGEAANQDVRFVLPQAAETKIVVTMNCRELTHFFGQRCCTRAQWEIRALGDRMLEICKEKLPAVFKDAGAKCVKLGYCPESRQFTCGKYPLKEDILGLKKQGQ